MFTVTGMASGLDTDNMLKQLLQVERLPVQRLEQQQASLRKVDDAWGEVTKRLSSLRTAIDGLADGGSLAERWATTSSNEATATATLSGEPTPGSTTVEVGQLATRKAAHSTTGLAGPDALVGTGDLTVTMADGTTTTVTATDTTTLAELATQIDAIAGVQASVIKQSEGDHRLVLTAEETGSAGSFDIDASPGSLGGFGTVEAQDAELTVGGLTVQRSSNTVTDLVEGVTLELQAVGTTTVTSSQDVDDAVGSVTGLVDEVNATLAKLKGLSDYNAESNAGGPLQGDPTVRRLVERLRYAVMNPVEGATPPHTTAGSVGISMNADGGFTVDEARLQAALADDPEAVDALFNQSGIVERVDQVVAAHEGTTGMVESARDSLTSQIDLYQDRIEAFELRIASREETLRRQFTAMETALHELQSQGDWLAGQLGGLSQPQQ